MLAWLSREQTNKPNWYIIKFMKKLMSSRPSGLAIVEVILVMSISALLFAVVIGTFATRRKAASDDAARQVMSEIAKVRNQAQQGQSTTSPGSGFELFGQAIMLSNNSPTITVYKLKQSRTTPYTISSYESYTINMPNSLKWFIEAGDDASSGYTTTYCNGFASCYGNFYFPQNLGNPDKLALYTSKPNIMLVFRNNTGQSYAFAVPTGTIGGASVIANYTEQEYLRLAFGIPGTGDTDLAKFAAGSSKYYANFDLAIPNNQDLKVVK